MSKVSAAVSTLSSPPNSIPTLAISLDDYYLPHEHLQSLAHANPANPLLQHRGQPSTHDVPLLLSTFDSLRLGLPTKIAEYDKSAFGGKGDRVSEEKWTEWNRSESKIRLVILEGWCVGFRSLGPEKVKSVWEESVAKARDDSSNYRGRLGYQSLESVLVIDEALKEYGKVFE